jgi:uncharacterized protein (AIM24 family)
MAGGLGTRLFVQGDVISAADVNGYLMNQSIMRFATTAERDTAFGNGIAVGVTVGGVAGDGKPLLQEGMFAYIDFDNDVTFYNGSQWVSAPTFVLADGEVTTAKIADDAVTSAKIADGAITSAHIADGTVIVSDIADGSVTSAKILDGTIVNADINASAAIAHSKLENATAGQVLLGTTTTGVVTATTISGDITINGAGVASIAANSVALGTDTTGNYMSDITAGTGLSVSHTAGEGSSAIVSLAGLGFTTSSAAYTLALTDNNNMVEVTATSNVDVTIPPESAVSWPSGTQIVIFRRGTGKVRVFQGAGVTILSTPGNYLRATNSGATLVRRDTNVWILFGDLSAT